MNVTHPHPAPTQEDFEQLQDQGYQIVGACIAVHREMGSSFERPVYTECLRHEFTERGIEFEETVSIPLSYGQHQLSLSDQVDFKCFGNTLIKVEAVPKLFAHHRPHMYQLLKQSGAAQGLVANFGAFPKLRWEKVFLHLPDDEGEWHEDLDD